MSGEAGWEGWEGWEGGWGVLTVDDFRGVVVGVCGVVSVCLLEEEEGFSRFRDDGSSPFGSCGLAILALGIILFI